MAFDFDSYEIRTNGIATCAGKFRDLTEITQDGRGYTIRIPSGARYRILRRTMDRELQRTLDAAQAGHGDAEEAV